MAKNILKAFFADDADDDDDRSKSAEDGGESGGGDESRPRSLTDAWERIAEQNRRLEARLESVEAAQKQVVDASVALQEIAKQQLEVLKYLGKFSEASYRLGREAEQQFRGVPDALRTLPAATKEQAERLSEIAARLYEKAQDNTVNAIRSAHATHQRAVEDLIERSLGATRRATYAAILTAAAAVAAALTIWLRGVQL